MLALLTHIRKLLTSDEEPNYGAIMKRTCLMQILDTVMSFETEPGDVYYMKLEAYWILNNLACCSSADIKLLLGDDSATGIPKGETLAKLSMELNRVMKEKFQDGRMLKITINALYNLSMTDLKTCTQVLTSTPIVEVCINVLNTKDQIDAELMLFIISLAQEMAKVIQITRQQAKDIICLLKVGLKSSIPKIQSSSLHGLCSLSERFTDLIPLIA